MKAEHLCPKCNLVIEYDDEQENLYDVALRHITDCKPAEAVARPNLVDDLPDEAKKADLVSVEDVLGKPILVKGFTFRDSTFKEDTEYLSLEVEVDGEDKVLNTGAERIVHAFKYVKYDQLPAYVTFEKVMTKAGRRVYRIVGTS